MKSKAIKSLQYYNPEQSAARAVKFFRVGKYKNLQTIVAGGTSLPIALRFLQTQKNTQKYP